MSTELRRRAERWLAARKMTLNKQQLDAVVRVMQLRDRERSMHAYGYQLDNLGVDDIMTAFMAGLYSARELR